MHRIGWLVLGVVVLAGCGGGTADATDATDTTDATTKIWESAFTPGLEMRGELRIVRLKGTPYEMGRQHAEFLRDEINGTATTLPAAAYVAQTDPFFAQLKAWGNAIWNLWYHNHGLDGSGVRVDGIVPFEMAAPRST